MGECNFGQDIEKVELLGNEVDPCIYETEQILANVTIEILKCPKCGKRTLAWRRQEDTVDITGLADSEEFI